MALTVKERFFCIMSGLIGSVFTKWWLLITKWRHETPTKIVYYCMRSFVARRPLKGCNVCFIKLLPEAGL